MTAVAEIEQVALEESTEESDGLLHRPCCRDDERAVCGVEVYDEDHPGEVTCRACRDLIERGDFHDVVFGHRHCPLDPTLMTICPRSEK